MKLSRTKVADSELVAAWHSDDTIKQLSERYGVSRPTIEWRWRVLKEYGKLPWGRRKAGKPIKADLEPRSLSHYPSDGRPTVWGEDGVDDLLLLRLYKVHRKPRFDLYWEAHNATVGKPVGNSRGDNNSALC